MPENLENQFIINPADKLKTGKKGRIGGPSDGKIGISARNGKSQEEIVNGAIEAFEKDYKDRTGDPFDGSSRQHPSETWFKFIKDRNPLLIVYLIDVASDDINKESINNYRKAMTNPSDGFVVPSVAIAMGFPQNDNVVQYSKKHYKANRTYNYFEQEYNYLETEEEE